MSGAFEDHRSYLLGLAYRMLGSLADAEDAVQDTYLRASTHDGPPPDNPQAWLTTVCSRICIDRLRKAKRDRTDYTGPWLPDPVPSGVVPSVRPDQDLYDSLSTALLLMLERLGPVERAAFLLHDVFGYSHEETAALLGRSGTAIRQTVSRARSRLQAGPARFSVPRDIRDKTTAAFFGALAEGDTEGLQRFLTEDALMWSDSDGKALAALNVLRGPDRIIRLLLGTSSKAPPDLTIALGEVNDTAAVLVSDTTGLKILFSLDVTPDGRVAQVFATHNPDKLAIYTAHLRT